MLFEFIIVFGLILLILDVSYNAAEAETVKRTNAVQDIGLTMETLITSPEKTNIRFPKELSAYTVEFEDNSILMYNESEPGWKRVRRHFIPYGGFVLDEKIVNEEYVYLFKIGPELGVGSETTMQLLQYRAVEVETTDAGWKENKKVYLVPIDGFTQAMAEYINSKARPFSPAEAKNLPLYDRPAVIINFVYDPMRAEFNKSSVFYPDEPEHVAENRKLAVLINNRLIEKLPEIKRTWVEAGSASVFPIFNNADIVIRLTITDDLKEKSAEIYAVVYEALEEYFK